MPQPAANIAADLTELQGYYAHALPGRQVIVGGRRPLIGRLIGSQPRPARFFAPVTVAIGLHQGALVITSTPSAAMRAYLRSRSVLGAIGGLVVLLVLALAVRQTTRPIADLSRGVRRFGADLDAPDLPLAGPREIRELAGSFNDMKARIRELMQERTRVLAAIAHDMRTYLTRLRLRAEYIDHPEQRVRAVGDLDEMAALLNDTLFLAEDEARAPSAIRMNLADAVTGVVDVRRDLGDAVTAETGGAAWVMASPIGVRRILDNLIDNGLRHGAGVLVRLVRVDETVELIVEDDGPGVAPEILARLGEPFTRGDPSRNRETGGAGLGLAIVRALAARDGATVGFANRVEGGLRVTVRYGAV
jgi:signal transduction histidine kinase